VKRKRSTAIADRILSVDKLMTNVSLTLVRDFQDNLNDPCYADKLQTELRRGDVKGIRRESAAIDCKGSIAEFKASYQLQSIVKRFRYQDDIYSDDELKELAVNGFRLTQDRLACQDLTRLGTADSLVLDLAARYVSHVLGPYNDEEHRNLCRFGSGASVGIPARLACLASRWELPLTGSQNQIAWFDAEMREIECVQDYWHKQQDSAGPNKPAVYQVTDSLTLTLVPKTFKSLRVIMPNTTIGSYMSYGLGEMMRKRLKRNGYNIKSLQQTHKYYACQGSIHGLYVTADLSSASDSITEALVRRLFPPDWFEILNQSRIAKVKLPDGSIIESNTFCTMGIGYTFPLQTLVFLSLLKAIEATMYHRNDKRLISVYGDDMVYSIRMHDRVVSLFESVGFVINLDKTFHEGNFRESCGGDYYHGVDVRPFQPRNGPASVGAKTYEAILYKCVNGLLARWTEYEIGRTLRFLASEIEMVAGHIKIVPADHPDDSGVKCSIPIQYSFLLDSKMAKPKTLGNGVFRFSYLRFIPDEREETRHEPYLWEALRDFSRGIIQYGPSANCQ
jgi:hypothetical protein